MSLARANHAAALADVINTTSQLRAIRKAAESLQMQVAVANIRLQDASRRVGAIRGALHALNIPELSLSDDEDNDDGSVVVSAK